MFSGIINAYKITDSKKFNAVKFLKKHIYLGVNPFGELTYPLEEKVLCVFCFN